MLALLVAAGVAGDPDPSAFIGPYGAVAALVAAVVWLVRERGKDRAIYDADVQAHRQQLDLERKANRELYDRIIEQQGHMAPLLEKTSLALEHVAQAQVPR